MDSAEVGKKPQVAEVSSSFQFPNTQEAIAGLPDAKTREVFGETLTSGELAGNIEILKELIAKKPDQNKLIDIQEKFAAVVFEDLAWRYLQGELGSDKIVLSPQQTFTLYQIAYPRKRVKKHNFGFTRSIEGVYLPDGLVISVNGETAFITGVCEYSLTTRPFGVGLDHKGQQAARNRSIEINKLLKYNSEKLGHFMNLLNPNLSFKIAARYDLSYYVCPERDVGKMQTQAGVTDVNVLNLPIKRRDFNDIIADMVNDVIGEDESPPLDKI